MCKPIKDLLLYTALVTVLASQSCGFVIQKDLELDHHNFAFLTSFCGEPTGAALRYTIKFPAENCCPSLLSYFESQWWEIWPDPHKNCTEKQSVLRQEWSQIQPLTPGNHLSGCKKYTLNTVNTTSIQIICKGTRTYKVHSYDPSKTKCWFIAANNCQSRGLKISYTFNITGAYYNASVGQHKAIGLLSTSLLHYFIIQIILHGL